MPRDTTVSIGMPVFNGAQHVETAVRSLLAQSAVALRLVIADDGSTDGTREICEHFALEDSRVLLLAPEKHLGMVGNFNRVLLACASDDYFMWAAQDDRWEPRFIEEGLARLAGRDDAVGFLPTVDFVDGAEHLLYRAALPSALTRSDRLARARSIGAREPWEAASAWNIMYGLLRTDRLPHGFGMRDVPAPDVPVAYALALAGPLVTCDQPMATRRVIGYERIAKPDGTLVWAKAIGPDGYIYSGEISPRCRAMRSLTIEAEVSKVERPFLLALITSWQLRWWRLRRVSATLAPRASRAAKEGRWFAAMYASAEAALLSPSRSFRAIRGRLSGRT